MVQRAKDLVGQRNQSILRKKQFESEQQRGLSRL
jgi:hypothetical protein